MPTYHYRCSACNHSFDQFQKFSETALTDCPECSGPIRRVPQPVGIVFKGSGWYVNDSRDSKSKSAKSSGSSDKSESPASTKSETAKDTAKSEPAKSSVAAGAES
jgi:putative FmdB family regulatory protein